MANMQSLLFFLLLVFATQNLSAVPLRDAKAKFDLVKFTLNIGPNGEIDIVDEFVCSKTMAVPVFDFRVQEDEMYFGEDFCSATFQKKPVEIKISGLMYLGQQSVFQDQAKVDVKVGAAAGDVYDSTTGDILGVLGFVKGLSRDLNARSIIIDFGQRLNSDNPEAFSVRVEFLD